VPKLGNLEYMWYGMFRAAG